MNRSLAPRQPRQSRIQAPHPGTHAGDRPAARIQLFTLRPFQVLIQGEPLRFAVRVQRKPMELLKTLVALGGQGVAEAKLGDALWPDSESDAALMSVRSTLHRLRKLLGRSVLSVLDGKLTLDPAQCWADSQAFTQCLGDAERETGQGNVQPAWDQVMAALNLYRSPFLDGEFHPPEILVMRERLHSQLLRQIVQLGRLLQREGDLERAVTLYRKGLEADPVAEELLRALMRAFRDLGRQSEAIAAYQRCREMLRHQWGIEPSPETEAIFQELSQSRNQGADPMKGSASIRAEPERPSIAVLPFDNLSGDQGQEYFSDGITEDIITQLARIPGLMVTSRHSSFTFKGQTADAREIGSQLGVSFLLEGSVRKAERRIRISAQLIDAKSGNHVWAENFDREATQLFDVQDQIIEEIAGRLNAEIGREQIDRARRKPPAEIKAHDLVLQAKRYMDEANGMSNQLARELLERAVQLDPNYALAMACLSLVFIESYKFTWSTETDLLDRAFDAARKAVDLDPLDPWARLSLAQAHFFRHEIPNYDAQAARALALNPHDSSAWFLVALSNCFIGRLEEAMRMIDKAMRLDPRHHGRFHWVPALYHYMNHRYKEALQSLLRVDALSFHIWHLLLAVSYGQMGRLDEARAAAAQVRQLKPDFDLEAHYQRYNMPTRMIEQLRAGARKAGLA